MNWISIFFLLASVALSISIAISDFRHREIDLRLLILYSLVIGGGLIYSSSVSVLLLNLGRNLLFISLVTLLIIAYFRSKYKKPVRLLDTYLGAGDLWILLTLALPLFWINYILFFSAATFLSLLIHLIAFKRSAQIPFAAYLVLSFSLVEIISAYHQYELFDESLVYLLLLQ